MPAIGFSSYDFDDVAYLIDGQGAPQRGNDVLMASGQTSALTATHRHPPGTVLVKKTSSGKYYLADDSTNADSSAAASVNTAITNPGSGGWDGTLNITGHWGSLAVTLSADDTDAAVAAKIIAAAAAANPESQAPVTAADATGTVSITNTDVGAGTWLKAEHATVATMMGTGGADANGTDPDVRVTTAFAELKNLSAVAQDWMVPTLTKGNFRTSALSNLTAEAQAVLTRRGSTFG